MATKVVKTKVVGSKRAKRMSKRFQIFDVYSLNSDRERTFDNAFHTRLEAERYIREVSELLAPVIVHIDIPPMEY